MKFSIQHIEPHFDALTSGSVLISEPFLDDYNFRRTVVLMTEHTHESTIGFVLNRLIDLSTNDVIPGMMKHNFPLFLGGPMEPNTLHFIHRVRALLPGSKRIVEDIFWGGNIEMIDDLIDRKMVSQHEFRFFSGYSGWGPNQLEEAYMASAPEDRSWN
jgi:putative transcriptional regulator